MHVCSVAQSWPTLCNAIDLAPEAHLSRDSPGKNTGVGFHALLQGIFLTQGLNTCLLHLLHWQEGFLFVCLFLPLNHLGSPKYASVQFSSVTQSCPTLCDPMNCSTPGLPVHHQFPELMSLELVMPLSHLILCRPLILLPPIPPSIRVFSSESKCV